MLRDLLNGGRTHFADFAAEESIATNTLAARLQRLRDSGIVARVRDPEDGRRWIYVPRRPAIELIPVLVDLMILRAARPSRRGSERERISSLASLRESLELCSSLEFCQKMPRIHVSSQSSVYAP